MNHWQLIIDELAAYLHQSPLSVSRLLQERFGSEQNPEPADVVSMWCIAHHIPLKHCPLSAWEFP